MMEPTVSSILITTQCNCKDADARSDVISMFEAIILATSCTRSNIVFDVANECASCTFYVDHHRAEAFCTLINWTNMLTAEIQP